MKRIGIRSVNHQYFSESWNLYCQAFPVDEKRDLKVQELIMKDNDYRFEVVIVADKFIGFIAWWQFTNLRFVEHFATLDIYRGKGYGKLILEDFISESKELVLLEVEHPTTEIDQRRIGFYERIGFELNLYAYQQLPMRKNGEKVDLLVMSHPIEISKETLNNFEKDFKEKCYDAYCSRF